MMLSFWMSPENSGKIGTVCASLVLLALIIVMLGNILPAPTDHVPCLGNYQWHSISKSECMKKRFNDQSFIIKNTILKRAKKNSVWKTTLCYLVYLHENWYIYK